MTQNILTSYSEGKAERALARETNQLEKAKKDVESGKTDLEKNLLRLLIREQASCCWSDDKDIALSDTPEMEYDQLVETVSALKFNEKNYQKKTGVVSIAVQKLFEDQGIKAPKTFPYYEAKGKLEDYMTKGVGIYGANSDRMIFFPAHVPAIMAVMDKSHTMSYDLYREGELSRYIVGRTFLQKVIGTEKLKIPPSPEQTEVQIRLQRAADTLFSSGSARSEIKKIHELTGEPIESIESTLSLLQDLTMVTELARLSNNPEYAYSFLSTMIGSQLLVHNKYNEGKRYKRFSRNFMEKFLKKFGMIRPGELTTRELLEVSDFTVRAFEDEVNQIFDYWKNNPDKINKDFVSKYLVL